MSLKTNLIEPAPNGTRVSIPALDQVSAGLTKTSIAGIEAITGQTAEDSVYLSNDGRSGTFIWKAGDYSTEVSADTQQGIYVAASSDSTGLLGCWVRAIATPTARRELLPEWFGAEADDTTDSTTAIQAALDSLAAGENIALASAIYRATELVIPNVEGIGIVAVYGKGRDTATASIKAFAAGDYVAASYNYVNNVTTSGYPLRISGVTFDGNSVADSSVILSNFYSTIEDSTFTGAVNHGLTVSANTADGSLISNSLVNVEIRRCFMNYNGAIGLWVRNDSFTSKPSDFHIHSNFMHHNGTDGVKFDATAGFSFDRNHLYQNGDWDLNVTRGRRSFRIINNIFEASGSVSVTVGGSSTPVSAAINFENIVGDETVNLSANSILGVVRNNASNADSHLVLGTNLFLDDGQLLLNNSANCSVSLNGDVFETATPFTGSGASNSLQRIKCANVISLGFGADKPINGVLRPNGSNNFPLRSKNDLFTITDGDTTPAAPEFDFATTANTGATNLSNFDNGVIGQEVVVIFGDANTTVKFSTGNLVGNAGADWTPADGDHMRCIYDGSVWRCSISDNTA